jgi:hypothetical protein
MFWLLFLLCQQPSQSPARRRVLGEVGDWCAACRRLQPFTIVSLVTGRLREVYCECWECGTAFECDEDDYDDFLTEEEVEEMPTAELLALTNTELKAEWDAWRKAQARPRGMRLPGAEVPLVLPVEPEED